MLPPMYFLGSGGASSAEAELFTPPVGLVTAKNGHDYMLEKFGTYVFKTLNILLSSMGLTFHNC